MIPGGTNFEGSYLKNFERVPERNPATEADHHSASYAASRLTYVADLPGTSNVYCKEYILATLAKRSG